MGYEYYIDGELICDPPIPARDWMPPGTKWSHFAALDHHGESDDKRGPWWSLFPVQGEDGSIATVKARGWHKSAAWVGIVEDLVREVALAKRFEADRRILTGRLVATGEDGDQFVIAVTDNHVCQLYTDLNGVSDEYVAELIDHIRADLTTARREGTLVLPKGARVLITRTGQGGLEIRLSSLNEDWAWEWRYTSATDNTQRAFGTPALFQAIRETKRIVKHRFDPADDDALKVVAYCPPDRRNN